MNDSAAGHANFGWDSVYTYIAVIVVVVGVAGIVMEGGRSRGCREERGSGRIGGSTTRIEEPKTVFEDVGEAACRPIHSNLPCGHIAPGLTDRTHICAGTSSQTGPQTSVHGLCGSPVWDCLIPTSRKGPQGTAVQSTALHGFPRYGKAPGLSAVPFGPRTLAAPGGTRSTEASSSSACTEAAALSAAPTGRTYGSRRPWWPSRQALEVSGGLRRFPDAP